MVLNGDNFFIRGIINPNTKFYLVCQTEYPVNNYRNIDVNFYATKHESGNLIFTNNQNKRKKIVYFTHTIEDGYIYLYHKGRIFNKFPLTISPLRDVDTKNLYSGMWYSLMINKNNYNLPLNWMIEKPSLFEGKIINCSSRKFISAAEDKKLVYSFLPKYYFPLNTNKSIKTVDIYFKWLVSNENIFRGVTQQDKASDGWYNYPKRRGVVSYKIENKEHPLETPVKKLKKNSKPNKIYTLSDFEKKSSKREDPYVPRKKSKNILFSVITFIISALTAILLLFFIFIKYDRKSISKTKEKTLVSGASPVPDIQQKLLF